MAAHQPPAAAAKQRGDAAFKRADWLQAITHWSEAIRACEAAACPAQLHVLYSNRAAAKLALQDWQGALADAQASVAANPAWVKGHFRSAKALAGLQRHEAALQAALQALALEPGNAQVQQLVVELQAQQPLQQQQLPWQQLRALRATLDLQRLPQQLVVGSRYLPSPDGVNSNLLLLLHGLGDTPKAFTALAQRIALPQTACLALSGPLAVPEIDVGRSWFEVFERDGELIQPRRGEGRRADSLAATVRLLQQQLLPQLAAVGGWRPEQLQLLGFSQGGTVALALAHACRGAQRLGGVAAVSAALLEEALLEAGASGEAATQARCGHGQQLAATDVLITHGDRDSVVPPAIVERSVQALRAAGCDVQCKLISGKGHGMISSEAEMRACMEFWAARLKSRPADDSFEEVPQAQQQ